MPRKTAADLLPAARKPAGRSAHSRALRPDEKPPKEPQGAVLGSTRAEADKSWAAVGKKRRPPSAAREVARVYEAAYRARNRERIREMDARWRAEHRDQERARYRKRHADNLEKERARSRAHYAANLESERKRSREKARREAPEKKAQRVANYLADPTKNRAKAMRRRALLAGAPGFDTTTVEDIERRWLEFDNKCYYCGVPATTTDHLTPLSRGGTHLPDNLVPACEHCNKSKGAKTEEEFMEYRRAA